MFSYNIEILAEEGYLHLVAKGEANAEQILDMYAETTEQGQAQELFRILLNAEELSLTFNRLELIQTMYKLKHPLLQFKLARVVKHIDMNSGLIESYSEQQQINIRNFESERDAKFWLLAN